MKFFIKMLIISWLLFLFAINMGFSLAVSNWPCNWVFDWYVYNEIYCHWETYESLNILDFKL